MKCVVRVLRMEYAARVLRMEYAVRVSRESEPRGARRESEPRGIARVRRNECRTISTPRGIRREEYVAPVGGPSDKQGFPALEESPATVYTPTSISTLFIFQPFT